MAPKKIVEAISFEEDDVVQDEGGNIVYVLCVKNEARGRVYDVDGRPIKDPEYPKRRNLLLRSSINWPGGEDPFSKKIRPRGRYLIRYYDGCTTLFIDSQPDAPQVLEPLIAGTREQHFIDGYLMVDSFDKMLKTYCDWASWNDGSPYRVQKVGAIFKLLDTEEMRRKEANDLDLVEKALEIAKKASVKHMRIHAKFLDVAEVDSQTMRALSDSAIRTEYRKAAMNNPKFFIETYNDKSMHIKHWIELAFANGELSSTQVPNRIVWTKRGIEVCDTSGLQTMDGIMNKLIELAQTDLGTEFKFALEALYNK